MALDPSVVTLEGYNATLKPDIFLDNVQFDNLNPEVGVASEFATFNLGPGAVNFGDVLGRGRGVTVNEGRDGTIAPKECKFPKLKAPQAPAGWKH